MKSLAKNINSSALKSPDEMQNIMNKVLKIAKHKGAEEASVAINHDTGFAVDLRMGSVETVAFSEDQGMSINVYIGNSKGSASSSDISEDALNNMVQAAIDIAQVSADDPCFGLPDKELLTNDYIDLNLFFPWDITPDAAIEMAKLCESQALNLDKRITNSDGVHVSTYEFSLGQANTYGFTNYTQSTRHSISCSLLAEDENGKQRDYDYTTSRNPKWLNSLENLAKNTVARTVRRLSPQRVKTQKLPVIFSSRIASSLFSSFISAISGGNLYKKNTFLLDSLETDIFPSWVQIYEMPHILSGLGSACFDIEGVPTRNNVFIKDGVLKQYVLNTYSARKLGLKTTANAGGVYNLTVDANFETLEDLLKKMDKGILVTELMGQGINILTGDYSRGASGFWIENGIIQYPVEEITIAGNLQQMFANIQGIGKDLNPNISTRCGSVLIAEMMVAGS